MKIIKTIFITLVLMSFFILSKVNAISLRNGNFVVSNYDTNENGTFFHNNVNFGSNIDRSFTITGGNTVTGYDYISFGFTLQYNHNGVINETTEINQIYMICSSWSNEVIQYADGTQATVSQCGLWQKVKYLGNNQFTPVTDETTSGNYSYNPNIQFAIYAVFDDNTYSGCTIEHTDYGTSLVTCPVSDSAKTLSLIRIRNIGSSYYVNIYGRFGITAYHTAWKDPSSIVSSNQQDTTNAINNVNNSLNNNNVSGANQDANSFVNNQAFQDNTGLTGIITAPLSVINSLTSTCSPIRLPIPYLDTNVDLPCIGDLLSSKMGSLIQLVKVVINGYICYLIGLDMFKIVKHARDPDDDRIEVLDL